MKFEIEKGDRFKCIRTIELTDELGAYTGKICYRQGRTYKAERDGAITDDLGDKNHQWDEYNELRLFFILIL